MKQVYYYSGDVISARVFPLVGNNAHEHAANHSYTTHWEGVSVDSQDASVISGIFAGMLMFVPLF